MDVNASRPTTILYVEDNAANVRFMADLLGGMDNLRLITAATAEAGLELARTEGPSIIIMDINLPAMTGIDALVALRAHSKTREIPVIALTAAASERERSRGIEAGFFRYLTKPVEVAELTEALQSLLSNRVASFDPEHQTAAPAH